MNSAPPSLLAKVLSAAIGFGLMAAVPLLTMQYVARAHAEPSAPTIAAHSCPRTCPVDARKCDQSPATCAKASCATEHCLAQ